MKFKEIPITPVVVNFSTPHNSKTVDKVHFTDMGRCRAIPRLRKTTIHSRGQDGSHFRGNPSRLLWLRDRKACKSVWVRHKLSHSRFNCYYGCLEQKLPFTISVYEYITYKRINFNVYSHTLLTVENPFDLHWLTRQPRNEHNKN